MPHEANDGNIVISQPHCEIEKTLSGGAECHNPSEILYRGAFLCGAHAALLELEDRAETVLGSVFRMDEWMEGNGSSSADEEFVGRVRHERDEAVGALRLMREQIRSARQSLSVGT